MIWNVLTHAILNMSEVCKKALTAGILSLRQGCENRKQKTFILCGSTHVHCVRNFNQNTWYARLNTSTTTRENYSQQYRPQVKPLMSIPHLRRYVHLMVHSVSIQNECLHRWVGRFSCMFSTPTWPHRTFLACSSSYSALASTYRSFVSHFRGAGYLLLML